MVDEAPFWPTLLLTMAGFVALLVAYATHQEGLDEALLLLVGIPTLAVPLILLLHFYGQYELGARQVVFFVPYWALSWSFLPVVLRNTRTVAHSRRPIQIVVTGVVLAWLVVWVPPSLQGLAAIRRSTYVPGWAEVTRYILQVLDEDDLLLVEDPRGLWFHAPELEPRIVAYYDKAHWSQEQVTEYAQAQLSSHDTVHVIPWRPGLMDEAFREWSTAAGGSTSEHCIGAICIQHSTLSPPQSTAP